MNGLRHARILTGARLLSLALPSLVGTSNILGQVHEESASDLIARLEYQGGELSRDPGFTCGQLLAAAAENRQTATSLAMLGSAASSEIEEAIDSIENAKGKTPPVRGAEWLLYAYAKIKGPEA